MAAQGVSTLLLAVPATFILALLLGHIRRNRGTGLAVAFALASAAYGLVRGAWVFSISASHNVPMPYRMAGSLRIGAASPMEVAGWMLAAALAWLLGATLVRVFGGRVGTEPAYRTAFAGALVLATLCLAVETAAIAAGWWDWSIPPPPEDFLRVPPIALVDWAFVAFDFLLPFLVFSRRSSLPDRAGSLCLFPLHFLSHRYLLPTIPSVPLSLFEFAHYGIPLWVFWRAAGEGSSAGKAGQEWGFVVPGLAALLVAADCALATVLAGHKSSMVFVLPLAMIGVLALAVGRRGQPRPASARPGARLPRILRGSAVAATLAVVLFVQLPANRRREGYARNFVDGVARLNAGDAIAAERLLRESVSLRPDKAEPHLILALALYRLGRVNESQAQLDDALRIKPALAELEEAKLLREALSQWR